MEIMGFCTSQTYNCEDYLSAATRLPKNFGERNIWMHKSFKHDYKKVYQQYCKNIEACSALLKIYGDTYLCEKKIDLINSKRVEEEKQKDKALNFIKAMD